VAEKAEDVLPEKMEISPVFNGFDHLWTLEKDGCYSKFGEERFDRFGMPV
jgi:hypothetical protein